MSFFGCIGHFFGKLFGKAPTTAQQISTTIKLVSPLTETIVLVAAGDEGEAKTQAVVNEVQSDLAAVSQFCADAGNGPLDTVSVTRLLTAVNTDLDALLTADHIKNPATKTKVEAIVKTITGELSVILTTVGVAK